MSGTQMLGPVVPWRTPFGRQGYSMTRRPRAVDSNRAIAYHDHVAVPTVKRTATPTGGPMAIPSQGFSLDAKFTQESGRIYLSGIQALVRLPLDQHRADKRRGLRTATFISGYRGSPLGGLDQTLERERKLLEAHHVVFSSGLNEDLGATAVFGSQMVGLFPRPKYDGVLGMWYGKAPGVDRTGDAFKHANYAGVGKNGGVLALVGDDPVSKSSTLPSHSEVALYDALMPTIFPGNVQEILDLGLHGFMLSRVSGLWVGMKIVTNVADDASRAARVGQALRLPEQAQPHHRAHGGRLARHHDHRQDLLRRATGSRRARAGRRGAAPSRHPHSQDGHALPHGAAGRARFRPGPRGDSRGRGEAVLHGDDRQGHALRHAGPAPHRG